MGNIHFVVIFPVVEDRAWFFFVIGEVQLHVLRYRPRAEPAEFKVFGVGDALYIQLEVLIVLTERGKEHERVGRDAQGKDGVRGNERGQDGGDDKKGGENHDRQIV